MIKYLRNYWAEILYSVFSSWKLVMPWSILDIKEQYYKCDNMKGTGTFNSFVLL